MATPTRKLDLGAADKPLDVGNGRVAASIGLTGQIQALSTLHHDHGYMVLSNDVAFDDKLRFDVDAVREHRRSLADPTGPGITLATDPAWETHSVTLLADAVPQLELSAGPTQATVITWAPLVPAVAGIVQTWELHTTARQLVRFPVQVTGLGHLSRASLTQLTEGGVRPAPESATTTTMEDGRLVLHNPAMPATAILDLHLVDPTTGASRPVDLPNPAVVLPPGEHTWLVLRIALAESLPVAQAELEALASDSLGRSVDLWIDSTKPFRASAHGAQRLARRAITYATANCVLDIGDTTCVLTDHRILPLAWTRDAYWTVTALAETRPDRAGDLVRRHLAWLFDVADRPDGWWARSYLPPGTIKDPAHQLDQQCYPLLEALDHARRCGDDRTLARHAPSIRDVLTRLLDRRHPSGLLPTDETPADDPLDLPFHLSSNLLAAHTFRRAASTSRQLGIDHTSLTEAAEKLLAAIREHFIIEVDGRRCLAYATDLSSARWYHDANDVPTVLAPRWGLDVPIETWQATMDLAFSPANPDAFASGLYGGLGSVHTPGAWPLGDAQELMFAAWTGDHSRADAIVDRLLETASWDASLPECRDPTIGDVRSRHWFAWPGCLLVLGLLMFDERTAGTW